MYPKNKEHLEAAQAEADKRAKSFYNTLSDEDKKKVDAVEEARQILIKNKVLFYLFPFLPNGDGSVGCWTEHSILELMEADESGFPTQAELSKNDHFECAFAHLVFEHFLDEPRDMDARDAWDTFMEKFMVRVHDYQVYLFPDDFDENGHQK